MSSNWEFYIIKDFVYALFIQNDTVFYNLIQKNSSYFNHTVNREVNSKVKNLFIPKQCRFFVVFEKIKNQTNRKEFSLYNKIYFA